jgi:hypothetical protein
MALDILTLAGANLIAQILLFFALVASIYYVRTKRAKMHCTITRALFAAQIVLIIGIMYPAMSLYVGQASLPLGEVTIIHHALGLASVVLWGLINIGYAVKVRFSTLKNAMRLSIGLWAISIALGLYLYSEVYSGL